MITVNKKLPDGTLILSNGFKLLPSLGTMPDGSRKPIAEMSESERRQFKARLMNNTGKTMSE